MCNRIARRFRSMKEDRIKSPQKIYPSDLRFRAGTELIAKLNGDPVPPTGIFKANKVDGHAEEQFAEAVTNNWEVIKEPTENALLVKIKRSPCPTCTSLLSQLMEELEPKPTLRLEMLSTYKNGKAIKGTQKFRRNVGLFARLRDAGIELSVWDVLNELEELGIDSEQLSSEQRSEIKQRSAGVQRVIDALPEVSDS